MDLLKESSVTESPNLTSIIDAFEAKRNPLELFFKEELRSIKYLEDKLNFIDGKIDDLREWLITYYPHMYLEKFDYKRCLCKLREIENKVIDLNRIYCRQPYFNEKNVINKPFNRSNFQVTCAQCETQFVLNNIKDINIIENHKHVADILATGNIPKFDYINFEETQKITVKKPRNINDNFPIQSISNIKNHYRCLLCQVLFRGKKSMRSHIFGKSHTKKLNNPEIYMRISDFVHYFQQLPQSYHIFQVLFDPAPQHLPSNVAFCTICAQNVLIENVPEHVTCNHHKMKFQANDYSFLNGYKEMIVIMKNATTGENNNAAGNSDTSGMQLVLKNPETSLKPDEDNVPSTSTSVDTVSIKKSPKKVEKHKKKHTIICSYVYSNNEGPALPKDFVPHRLQNHLKFIDDCNTDINFRNPTCTLCQFIVKKPCEIVAHFLSEGHKLKSRLEFNESQQFYCYYCCLCCKYFKKDTKWMEHLNSLTHRQKESFMPKPTIQTIFKEYECINCSLVWYGQQHSINAHKKDKFGSSGDKRWKPKEVTLSNEIVKLLKDEVAFAADIYKASKESTDVLNAIDSATKCCRAIEEALRSTFGEQIKAYPFGSRVSGLGNIASDLDVFVDIGSMYEGTMNQNAEFQSYCVQQTAQALRRHRDFTDVCPIPQARTPIVQVFHKITDLDCDLSFRHGLSIENTEFLRFCIKVQPKLKLLILFLKKWIRLNKFRDRISTYGISLMSIYMMQNKGYMPSLAKLRQIDPQKSKIIAGWETFNFQKPISELEILYPAYSRTERELLAEFFSFYVNFDYERQVICPLLGQSIPKEHFLEATGSNLPKEMLSYVHKIRENEDNERIKITKSICLQDPFDLSHNVTKALPIELLVKMIILMKQSYQLIHK